MEALRGDAFVVAQEVGLAELTLETGIEKLIDFQKTQGNKFVKLIQISCVGIFFFGGIVSGIR